jgi:N-acyl-D-amino-acid deacylase
MAIINQGNRKAVSAHNKNEKIAAASAIRMKQREIFVAQEFDLVVRGGTIVDGSGSEGFKGDVAIKGDKIAAIGKFEGTGKEEIDAKGKLVTPGFVDIHTHYDGQAIWSQQMTPSSQHGVTTVVAGNCGVGFAPCRKADQELLMHVMEGVEDIPEAVMSAGLDWHWETFPEYLNAVDSRGHDIDIAAYLPHSALRVYVMGERGANREEATDEDLKKMKAIARDAIKAGGIGFATSRVFVHRTPEGEFIPSYNAAEKEIMAIAEGMAEAGRGVLQFVLGSDKSFDIRGEVDMVKRIVKATGRPASFTYGPDENNPGRWREMFAWLDKNHEEGIPIRAQVLPRIPGMILGFNLSVNPFCMCPTYMELAKLPLAERVAELRKPEMRAKLLVEQPIEGVPLVMLGQNFDNMFPLDPKSPNYEPDKNSSVGAQARAKGISPKELAYDLLLENDGNAMFYCALGGYNSGNLDMLGDVMQEKNAIMGLGDGGAHYGMICDASYTTFVLTHWTRDRARGNGKKFTIPMAINALARKPAETVGFMDRGLLAVGYKADVNIIDYDNLSLGSPFVKFDLPAGGRRLMQVPTGIDATIVSGKVTYRNGVATGELPGRLVRGQQELVA